MFHMFERFVANSHLLDLLINQFIGDDFSDSQIQADYLFVVYVLVNFGRKLRGRLD